MESIPELIEKLTLGLQPWRSYLIAVDGRDGVGKSPLSRKLAYELKVPLVETDLFLESQSSGIQYRNDCLVHVINARLKLNRPVIVEGVFVQQLLDRLNIKIDFLIYVTSPDFEGSLSWAEKFSEYEAVFKPSNANFHVKWIGAD